MMLPKATWLRNPGCLAPGEWAHHRGYRSFLYCSSVYSSHLFLISSASVRSIPFLSFIMPIFALKVSLASLILFKRSLVFPILLFSSISLHWSLRKAFLSLLYILWNSAFRQVYLSFLLCLWLLFFSQLFVRLPQTSILTFCISIFEGDVLDWHLLYNVTNLHPYFFRHCIRLIPWIYLSHPLYNHKGFVLGHTWII